MPNENRDRAAWKSRLEDPAILGLTSSESNALWEKLDERLCEKPRRKRVIWYRAAAACLLLAMLLPFIHNKFKVKEPVNKTAVKQQPAALTAPEIVPAPSIAPVESSNVVVEKKQTVPTLKDAKTTKPALDNVVFETANADIAPEVQTNNQPLQSNTAPISNTPVIVAAAGPVLKQKLKVIHINELGYPEEPTRREDHIADYRSVRFNPVSPEAYTITSTAQNISDLNFFKTKTTPSN